MSHAVPWLPPKCLSSRQTAEPVRLAVEEWASDWIGVDQWHALGTWDATTAKPSDHWSTIREGQHIQMRARPKAMLALGFAILGAKPHDKCNDMDLKLLRRLATRAVENLLDRVEEVFASLGMAAPARTPASVVQYSLLIGIGGGAQLALECGQADLVYLSRSTFGKSQDLPMLDELESCFRDQRVNIEAHIGRACISVGQLADLEVGDTLVLDRLSNLPASLVVETRMADLPVSLAEAGGRITLELQEIR